MYLPWAFCLRSFITFSLLWEAVVSDGPHEITPLALSVGTYNLWNLMFNWKVRIQHMADLIREADVDVVAFQEVRLSSRVTGPTSANKPWISQLGEFRSLLPGYKWSVVSPSGPAAKPHGAYWSGWDKEGLGFLSRKPIISSSVIQLKHSPVSQDKNERIALHAQIRVGEDPAQTVHVIVVHFSYDKNQQCQNAGDLIRFIQVAELHNVVVLGDFNAYNNFLDPVDAFTSKNHTKCSISKIEGRGIVGAFQDVWLAAGNTHAQGLTFSNMPEPGLVSRPDRILVPSHFHVTSSGRSGAGEDYKRWYHYSIVAARTAELLRTSFASMCGWRGYSCTQDCGPHGSCRCGMCVAGGDQHSCSLPDCPECSSRTVFICVCLGVPSGIALLTLLYSVVRLLVVSARFNQSDIQDILGHRCCLFNRQLIKMRIISKRYKSFITRLFCLCNLPPLLLLILMVGVLLGCWLLSQALLDRSIRVIFSILREEEFPSDHLFVYTHLKLVPAD